MSTMGLSRVVRRSHMRQFCTGLEFDYSLRWPSGSQPPVPRFVQLAADEVTTDFARDAATSHRLGWIGTRLHRLLRNWKSVRHCHQTVVSLPLTFGLLARTLTSMVCQRVLCLLLYLSVSVLVCLPVLCDCCYSCAVVAVTALVC